MAKAIICDGCGQPTKRIALKLYATERSGEQDAKQRPFDHSKYVSHADIGECCADRLRRIIRWQARKSTPRRNAA